MAEITIIVDELTDTVLLEGPDHVPAAVLQAFRQAFGHGQELGCARPLVVLPPPEESERDHLGIPCLRVSGYYHNCLVEGPGRRSSLLVSGCDLACRGCWVPFLHPTDAGTLVPVERLADALLDPAYKCDGVSILGGEPMQQPEGLLVLIRALRVRGCPHILVYSGYTYEWLRRMAGQQSAIDAILDEIDVVIDGPYVQALSDGAGPWTGSANQRVIDLVETRRVGRVGIVQVRSC